jgi:hypothetical protein
LHYYVLAGHLIGSFDGTNTTFYLTNALGSVLTSFSQSAILGEQERILRSGLGETVRAENPMHTNVSALEMWLLGSTPLLECPQETHTT